MTRYLAERPRLIEADERFIDTAAMYFHVLQDGYGPSYAAERTARLIEDRLTARQTGIGRPSAVFGDREMCRYWDGVAESHRDTANDIAALMKDGNLDDARCALAATLDAIEPEGRVA
jgi:hypothetical protein